VQATLLRALEHRETIRCVELRPFLGWLRTTADRQMLMALRSPHCRGQVTPAYPRAGEHISDAELDQHADAHTGPDGCAAL